MLSVFQSTVIHIFKCCSTLSPLLFITGQSRITTFTFYLKILYFQETGCKICKLMLFKKNFSFLFQESENSFSIVFGRFQKLKWIDCFSLIITIVHKYSFSSVQSCIWLELISIDFTVILLSEHYIITNNLECKTQGTIS